MTRPKDTSTIEKLNIPILESMDDMVRVIGRDGRVLYANEAMNQFCKRNIEGLECTLDNAIMPRCISSRAFSNKEPIVIEQMIEGKYYSVKSSPVEDDEGKVIAAVEVFRDITAQTRIRNELFNANRKMTDDIRLAKRIQTGILPRVSEFKNLRFDYRYIPSDQLSGDIFDVIIVDEDHVVLYIADVVGHGISASIMTMFIRQTMRSVIQDQRFYSPSEVLNEVKNRFGELNLEDSQYFSMFYAVVNLRKNTLGYSNAGHNCEPILARDGELFYLRNRGKLISNAFENGPYREKLLFLEEGDVVLFYTDGVVETMNREKEMYGTDRLAECIRSANPDALECIVQDLDKYRWGEQLDDIALIYMQMRRSQDGNDEI